MSPDTAGAATLPYGLGHRMLTVAQVADWFQLSEKAVRRRVDKNTIPYRQLGDSDRTTLRFDEQELVEWSKPKAPTRWVTLDVPAPRQRRQRTDRSAM